ncbi:MAG: right-handed parallel beta-helix repeat-containing protein [Candidatus Sumerlaeia bacterium]|nr:right-handed parallel beta-helix repeat-containing protein [Candidatus Sumerlaeia bacterium]
MTHSRGLVLLLLLVLGVASLAPASDVLELERLGRLHEYAAKGRPVAKALNIPAPLPGSPEYLVRAIYLIPSDRIDPDPVAHQARVAHMVGVIRTALETIDDFYALEAERLGVANPGVRLNLEREPDGAIRVMVLNGTRPTAGADGYWGNTTGTDGGAIWFRVQTDLFGAPEEIRAATAKTVFVIFPDVGVVDDSVTPSVWRGTIGLGSSTNASTSGSGGIAMMTANSLEFLPADPGDRAARLAALQQTLCSADYDVELRGRLVRTWNNSPATGAWEMLTRGEQASIFLGVLAHEALHAFGIVHDLLTADGLMGSGYLRLGAAMRQHYAFPACPAVPLTSTPWRLETQLGEPFARFLTTCPYFDPAPSSQRVDPTVEVAWPPVAAFVTIPTVNGERRVALRARARDNAGVGLHLALFYQADALVAWRHLDESEADVPGSFALPWWDSFSGSRTYHLNVVDRAGNLAAVAHPLTGIDDTTNARQSVVQNSVWVRRPAPEDTRPRNAQAQLGSFENPHGTVAAAFAAIAGLSAPRAVVVGRGVHPVTSSLSILPGTTLIGEEPGACILDGQGNPITLIRFEGAGVFYTDITIANLVFRNAAGGIRQVAGVASWENVTANNVFHGLTGTAIELGNIGGNQQIVQNTIVQCGAGVVLNGYFTFGSTDSLRLRNNLVAGCAGVGIQLDNVHALRTRGRSGHNNAFFNGTNFAGAGMPADTGTYTTMRLPGELAFPPLFALDEVGAASFRLGTNSPLLRAGDPWGSTLDGQRRGIGALFDPAPETHTDRGDVDGDGHVTPADAQAAFGCFLTGACAGHGWPLAGDVVPGLGDARVTPADAQAIFRLALGQLPEP